MRERLVDLLRAERRGRSGRFEQLIDISVRRGSCHVVDPAGHGECGGEAVTKLGVSEVTHGSPGSDRCGAGVCITVTVTNATPPPLGLLLAAGAGTRMGT